MTPAPMPPDAVLATLRGGAVIPALPLALDAARRLDDRRQRALIRYYLAAGAGGVAVGVHTTQFAIREARYGLFRPILELAAEEIRRGEERRSRPVVRIGGVCGRTEQAVGEALALRDFGYHAGLLSLAAYREGDDRERLAHCRAVAEVIPLVGFYLQPAVGGAALSYRFWREFAEIPNVVAIKIAPFNRYQTLDVVRAVVDAGREDLALYTGNDDNIVLDLVMPFRLAGRDGERVERRIVGGLLGQWAVWTRRAVELLEACRAIGDENIPRELLAQAAPLTLANAAVFDVAHGFRGCIAGIHEVLRGQGLLEGTWCLDPDESLSPGQAEEIDRIRRQYPELTDDSFVSEHRDEWLDG